RPVPAWMPRLAARSPRPWVAWGLAACVVAGSLALLPKLRFDGELRHLDAQSPEALGEYEEVSRRFGVNGASALIISRGAKEEALQRNDGVVKALIPFEQSGAAQSVRSVALFLPAQSTQRARAEALSRLDLTQAKARLLAGAQAAGFTATAFDGFRAEVEAVA